MQIIDPSHPFYAPAWRRYAIVGFLVAWSAVEALYFRDGFWATVALAMLALAAWTFIFAWRGPTPNNAPDNTPPKA